MVVSIEVARFIFETGEYVRWVDDHRHAFWIEFKHQRVDEHAIADLVSQILNEIAHQLDYVDELDPWVNEDALIETLNTSGTLQ